VLLFLDADTWLLPGALARVISEYRVRDVKALSLGPWHEAQAPYEQLSAGFNLMTFMGLGAFGLWDSEERPKGLFGPFLMIDRTVYRNCGGHQAVRGEILEHMSLAPRLESERVPMVCLSGRTAVHFRMYPGGLRDLIQGWTKAFATGASKTPPARMTLVVLWIVGSMMAFLSLLVSPWFGPGGITPLAVYLAFVIQWGFFLWRVGRFSPWTALFYPIPLLFFFGLFGRSSWLRRSGKAVTWKGRSIG
jgi:4,4'-diaponeurosporenoate glycosyltransferase